MLKNILALGTLTLTFLGLASAAISSGSCPTLTLKDNFDPQRYTGTWFEQVRDLQIPYEYGECVQARYSLNEDGTIKILNSQFNEKTGQVDFGYLRGVFNGAKGCVDNPAPLPCGDYEVVDTDYDNYTLIYSCT